MTLKHFTFAAAALLLSLAGGITAYAANAVSDQQFVQTVIGINLAEISVGQLAQKNGSTDAVKQFGAKLVADHTANNKDAMALAAAQNIQAPNQPSEEDQAAYKDLSSKTGADFDKAFADMMVKGHTAAIQMFTDKIGDTSANKDVVAFAQKTLPTLKDHLATAQKLESGSS